MKMDFFHRRRGKYVTICANPTCGTKLTHLRDKIYHTGSTTVADAYCEDHAPEGSVLFSGQIYPGD